MKRRNITLALSLIVLTGMVSGCLAVAAGAGAGAGTYRWYSGKLTFTTPHTITECHDATLAAFRDLGITLVSDRTDKLAGKIHGQTAVGEDVKVDLEPQGDNITNIDVRVGFWGNRTQSTRVADAIQRHL
ncbi:MAG: hypothetical protein Kow0099_39270 [Candidatus Abyssubacteria bacterium]